MSAGKRYLVTERFHVDRDTETLVVDGSVVPLHHKAYRVLLELMTHPEELVTKRALFENVWETLEVSDAVLTTAIKEIRQALGDNARAPWAIATVHGRGYRLLVNVTASDQPERTSGTEIEAPASMRFSRRSLVLLLLVLVALGSVTIAPNLPFFGSTPAAAAEQSIAVLPFDDLSPAGDQTWFAKGIAEEILHSLAQSNELLVAARTSSFRYGGDAGADIREIANALNVTHVMEGSVRRAADGLRITAQLIRGSDGFHVWSKTYDFPLATRDAVSIQRDIANDVFAALDADAPHSTGPGYETQVTLEAYERFLRGRELVMLRRGESVLEGLEELNTLVHQAPEFAPGHAWLAYALLFSTQFAGRPVVQATDAARFHVERAMELEPNSADSLTAAAMLELARRDVDQALIFADRAVSANPNHVPALRRRGVILLMKGQADEALGDFLAVRARDPLSAITLAHVADIYFILNDAERSLDAAREGVRWNPGDALAHGTLGRLLAKVGDYAAAIEELEQSSAINPNGGLHNLALSVLYWRVGMDDHVAFAEEELTWPGRAAAAFSAGDPERGLELAEAFDLGATGSLVSLHFYHWYGDMEKAYAPALRLADRNRLAETGLTFNYRPGAIPVMLALVANGDPQAQVIRERLEALFDHRQPGDFAFDQDIFGAASWRMVNNDPGGALRWLEDALERGMIFRELGLDPIWNPLRDTADFQEIVAAMEQRAAEVRRQVGNSPG